MANTYLTRSKSSPTSDKKGTISFWFKRSKITAEQVIIVSGSGSIDSNIYLNGSNDKLHVYDYQSGAFSFQYITTRVFRDTSAWTHLTVEIDTTLATASDRVKIYINGVRETAFDTSTAPSQNATPLFFTSANPFYIGAYRGSSSYFDGLLSHFHYTDGYAYGASTFGSTDSTTGEWKINTSPSITMGTNGFTILKDGNTITDQSSNSNNFTLGGGTLTSTKDCPSNVYATWNVLNRNISTGIQSGGVANGNTYLATLASNGTYSFGSTLALKGTGKFYMEFKVSQTGTYMGVGIAETDAITTMLNAGAVAKFSDNAKGWSYKHTGYKENGGSQATYGATYTANDYIGLAYNNGTIWFSKNGTWQNSATISEINAGTTTNSAFTGLDTSKDYFIMFDGYNDSMIEMNAGNGWFRTTEISSPNNPTSGDTGAKFKYTVPTGYQPLSTKGLNE